MGYLYLTFSYGSGVTTVHGARGQKHGSAFPRIFVFFEEERTGLESAMQWND